MILIHDLDATLAPLTPQSSLLDKTAAVTEIGASFASITNALKSSTDSVRALTPACAAKRSISVGSTTLEAYSEPKSKRQLGIAVAVLLVLIIVEIFATITAAVAILGLSILLVFLNPLTGGLGALILAVQLLVDVLLIDVIIILNTLLTGLALTLGGL